MNENQLRPICQKLSNLITGSNLSRMLEALQLPCDLDNQSTKWKRLFNAIVIHQNHAHNDEALRKITEWIMSPVNFVDNQPAFYNALAELNPLLCFMGLELTTDGKIHNCKVALTLEEANLTINRLQQDLKRFHIHPQILICCRPEIISENLFHLTFEASKCLMEKLREISGLKTDGNTLVNQCFAGSNPLLVMNTLSTQDEQSEHRGLHALLNTIVYLYRNPKAHTPKHLSSDTYQSTLEALIMISRARYALEHCARNNTR